MNTLFALTALTAASTSLALSDGTPVEFVKITSKNNIQVRLPDTHPLGEDDDLRIFRRDGSHYKDETDLKLVVVDATAAAPATTAAPAAAPVAPFVQSDNVTYIVDGQSFGDDLAAAKAEAIDLFRDTGQDVDIVMTTSQVIGRVGFTQLAA